MYEVLCWQDHGQGWCVHQAWINDKWIMETDNIEDVNLLVLDALKNHFPQDIKVVRVLPWTVEREVIITV